MKPFNDAPYATKMRLNLDPCSSQNALDSGFTLTIAAHIQGNSL